MRIITLLRLIICPLGVLLGIIVLLWPLSFGWKNWKKNYPDTQEELFRKWHRSCGVVCLGVCLSQLVYAFSDLEWLSHGAGWAILIPATGAWIVGLLFEWKIYRQIKKTDT